MPTGTSRMLTLLAVAFAKSDPAGVTTICTVVKLSTFVADAGAVYTTVARPFASVTMFRADSVPKSTSVPLSRISALSDTLRSG